MRSARNLHLRGTARIGENHLFDGPGAVANDPAGLDRGGPGISATPMSRHLPMLGPPKPRRLDQPIAVSLEDLVPQDHFYRHLEAKLDLSFGGALFSTLSSTPKTVLSQSQQLSPVPKVSEVARPVRYRTRAE